MVNDAKKSFWTTIPGILTAIAAIITAITGLLVALSQIWYIDVPPKTLEPKSPQTKQELPDFSTSAISNVVFSDDFSEQTLGDFWQPVSGDWYVIKGVLNGEGAHYTNSRVREWAAITLAKDIPKDCSVSFRIKIIDGSTAELMFHLSKNRYIRVYIYEIDQAIKFGDGTFIRDNRPGSIGLEKVLESIGGGTTLAQHGFPVKLGVWYRIAATSKGKEYKVKVGGQTLIEYIDTKNKLNDEGTIGLLTNGHVQFDDIVITSKSSKGGN